MHFETGLVHITNMCFGSRTTIDNRTVFIDRQELVSVLSQEALFDGTEIEIAHPEESCRIVHGLDVLDPRYRLNGPNYPAR